MDFICQLLQNESSHNTPTHTQVTQYKHTVYMYIHVTHLTGSNMFLIRTHTEGTPTGGASLFSNSGG